MNQAKVNFLYVVKVLYVHSLRRIKGILILTLCKFYGNLTLMFTTYKSWRSPIVR